MKPLERVFFQACWLNCHVWRKNGTTNSIFGCKAPRDIVKIFSKMGFPHKRLWWYLEKWWHLGFYDYGVSSDLGWFEEEKLTGEYIALAEQADKYKA